MVLFYICMETSGLVLSSRNKQQLLLAVVARVQEVLSARQANRYEPSLPFFFAVLGNTPHFYGLIFQWDHELKYSLLILEWIFLHAQPHETITTPQEAIAVVIRKGRTRLCSL